MSNDEPGWLERRLPLGAFWRRHIGDYRVPRNLNVFYLFGSLLLFILALQVLTGLWLLFGYEPIVKGAFASVQLFMREVPFGWLIRYLHAVGASALFVCLYLHMLRGLLYGSYRAPRELVWSFGVLLYLLLLAQAFFGYLLPWGQLSYWGAQVSLSAVEALPLVGPSLADLLRGGVVLSDASLRRFQALHVVGLPLLILTLVSLHVVALRQTGSNNPEGDERDVRGAAGVPFHPYLTLKDLCGLAVFLLVFLAVVLLAPDLGGLVLEPANQQPADPLVTPAHIAPPWYLAPFYALLRAVPSKAGGLGLAALAIALLFVLPWLDRSAVRSVRHKARPARLGLYLVCLAFVALGILGVVALTDGRLWLARLAAGVYFTGLLGMPWYSRLGRPRAPAESRS
ncbi:cytochrome bc complex cytochrome b subunit [Pseudomonas oryzihabitans]|uniref:cytochrome b n=1 Tax=Pseudomonas oryzihabitans TaxID=47885 RepID=UPI0021DB5197|nr:cytochrome bc complex cytochrome b subunit [Pseudomonas oryzihabitans]MDK8265924.1 cytochrome bc complex cytochrome b subunit [Pseudomonas oryzihabitans]